MRIARLGRPSRLLGWAFAALLTAFAFGPTQADAGCLHPASLLRSNGSSGTAHFSFLTQNGAMLTPAEMSGESSMPSSLPPRCPGGFCAQPPLVPIAPASTPAPRAQEWAALAEVPPPLCLNTRLRVSEAPLDLPVAPELDIFHPPRLSLTPRPV
jgi:hypothetical protein